MTAAASPRSEMSRSPGPASVTRLSDPMCRQVRYPDGSDVQVGRRAGTKCPSGRTRQAGSAAFWRGRIDVASWNPAPSEAVLFITREIVLSNSEFRFQYCAGVPNLKTTARRVRPAAVSAGFAVQGRSNVP
jgi:hypothetical protein